MQLEHKTLDFKMTKKKTGDRIIRGFASTPDVDSVGDSMNPLGVRIPRGKVRFLYNHSLNHLPIGPVLNVWPQKKGVEFEAKVSRTSFGDDIWILAEDKAIDELSIGFVADQKSVEYRTDMMPGRKVRRVNVWDLHEVSMTPFAVNQNSTFQALAAKAACAGGACASDMECKCLLHPPPPFGDLADLGFKALQLLEKIYPALEAAEEKVVGDGGHLLPHAIVNPLVNALLANYGVDTKTAFARMVAEDALARLQLEKLYKIGALPSGNKLTGTVYPNHAFKDVAAGSLADPVPVLWGHRYHHPGVVGVARLGWLPSGIKAEIELADSAYGKAAWGNLETKNIYTNKLFAGLSAGHHGDGIKSPLRIREVSLASDPHFKACRDLAVIRPPEPEPEEWRKPKNGGNHYGQRIG